MEKKDKPFKGWECPRCKQINAPWVPYCDCKEEEKPKSETITWSQNDHYNTWNTTITTPLDKQIYTTVTGNATKPNTITLDSTAVNATTISTTLDDKGE